MTSVSVYSSVFTTFIFNSAVVMNHKTLWLRCETLLHSVMWWTEPQWLEIYSLAKQEFWSSSLCVCEEKQFVSIWSEDSEHAHHLISQPIGSALVSTGWALVQTFVDLIKIISDPLTCSTWSRTVQNWSLWSLHNMFCSYYTLISAFSDVPLKLSAFHCQTLLLGPVLIHFTGRTAQLTWL